MNNTIENLRKYNLWRRGDESIEQPDPKDIGIWIDEICEIAEKLERERDEARELVYAWESRWKAEVEFVCRVSIKRDKLLDILRKLLEIIPEPECHDFGHTKEERHAFLEKCPVMARYDALIAQAKEETK